MYIVHRTDEYLAHHGIKGQKWGVRNGPPYPLQGKGSIQRKTSKHISLSDKEFTSQSIMNPMFGKEPGASGNCGNIALAEEQRNRGKNVRAKLNKSGMYPQNFYEIFEDVPKENSISLRHSIDELPNDPLKNIEVFGNDIKSKFPNGSRGTVYVPAGFTNHFMPWKIDNTGNIHFGNPQDESYDAANWFADYSPGSNADNTYGVWCMRTDNVKINENEISKYTEPVSNKNPEYMDASVRPSMIKGKNFITTVY